MTPNTAERVRQAALHFADELVEALNADAPEPDRLLDIASTAEALSIGRSKVYSEIAAGRLRSLQIGDRRLISSGAIREYIAAQSPPGAGK